MTLTKEMIHHKNGKRGQEPLQDQLRTVFEHLHEAVIIHRPDGRIMDVNRQMLNLYGLTREEALSCTIADISSSENPVGEISRIWKKVLEGERQLFEWKARRPRDGVGFDVEVYLTRFFVGEESCIIGTIRDISKRKKTEEVLRQNEALYRSIFENSLFAITVTGPDFKFLQVNAAFCRLMEYDTDELIGKRSVFDITHPDDMAVTRDRIGQLVRRETNRFVVEKRYITKSGKIIEALTFVNAIYDEAGRYIASAASIMDITERKRVAELIQESKNTLQMIFDGISEPLIVLDKDGLVKMLNRAALHYFRLPEYRMALGKSCYEAFFGNSAPCEGCENPFSNMRGMTKTFELKRKNGSERLEQVTVYSVNGDSDSLEATIVRIRDITQARRMERQLVQNEKLAALGLLVSGIAHEISNPNSFIAFNIPILRDYLNELIPLLDAHEKEQPDFEICGMSCEEFKEDLFKLLTNMEHGATRITRTVTGLREFSKDRDSRERRWCDLNQVIGQAVALCGPEIRKRVRHFDMDLPDRLPQIFTSPEAVEQIVVNLLINAVQATDKEDSTIRLSMKLNEKGEQRQIIIEVTDNGCGMDEETRERIFDPFFTTKPSMMGTGLGLYVCHNLIRSLGGCIEVESEPGKGSTFRIVLQK